MDQAAKSVTLETAQASVEVLPGYGARVVSFVDKRDGRDWMAPGGSSRNTGEQAVYAEDEAVGWDECFPTVSPWDATGTVWGRMLRDHGDLWGRPWAVDSRTPTSLGTSYAGTGFRFSRNLSLVRSALTADYRVENTGGEPLPFIWALHGLLSTMPGEEIRLPGVDHVAATYLSIGGHTEHEPELIWPGTNKLIPFPLDRVQTLGAKSALKLYADMPDAAIAVGGPGGWLEIAWQGIASLGIWLSYGGWPQPGSDVHQIALEPTTASVDHLGQALERGTATILAPGAATSWRVTLTLRADAPPERNRP